MSDDWPNPRSRHDYLTEREIETLRRAFNEGQTTADAADTVNCSTRIAAKYYAQFRGGPLCRGRPKTPSPQPIVRPSRFYKSNFEI